MLKLHLQTKEISHWRSGVWFVLTFTAVFTGVWFDAGVKHLVLLEVGFGGVGVTADGTHEGLHARVGLHVQS